MPELPEVETVRRGLLPVMEGRRIERALVRRPDLRWPFPERMAERLTGDTLNRHAPWFQIVDQSWRPVSKIDYDVIHPGWLVCLAGVAIPQQDLVADLAEREAACDLLTQDQASVLDRLEVAASSVTG